MTNIRIKDVAIYHPNNEKGNGYFIDHFKEKGRDITNFLKTMGRERRYIIDNDQENTITMGIESAKKVLEKTGLSGNEIDMVIFSTQVPEMTFPTNAMYVHHAIGGKERAVVQDSNANCAGMTVSVEQAARYLMSNPRMKTALVVGSDYNSLIANPEEEITYANYGDASAAVVLEKTEEETGFIDSVFSVNSGFKDNILYPEKGLAQSVKGTGNVEAIKWLPFDGTVSLPDTYRMIEELIEQNDLTINDIDHFCLSQFALTNILKIQGQFDIPDKKITYIGDEFGYTGTSSPFIALHEGVEKGQIKRGDKVLFWTIGTGHILIAMLFQY